jgi:anti-sigma factor RsiW
VIGHLGSRVSALLDGQLPPAEAERAWAHVHACHLCRDLVEREGWVKTRLSGLPEHPRRTTAPDHLKSSLRCGAPAPSGYLDPRADVDRPRRLAVVLLGGSAAGVAVLGVLALGLGQTQPSTPDRRAPVTDIGGDRDTDGSGPVPVRVPGQLLQQASPSPSR